MRGTRHRPPHGPPREHSRWRDTGALGKFCNFEGTKRLRQLGINLNILEPGNRWDWNAGSAHRKAEH
jgi:hypothetical protein